MSEARPAQPEPTPMEKFEALAKQVLSVPKEEIDKRDRARRAKQNGKPRRAS